MIVIDSSSLILLAKIGILDKVITNLKETPTISEKIYEESTAKEEAWDAKLIKQRVEKKVIAKTKIADVGLCQKIKADFNFGEGEAEAITLCLEKKASLIIDDKKAINACRILGIKFTTAGRLLIRLYSKNLIRKDEAHAYLSNLKKFGRYARNLIQKMKEELEYEEDE